MSERYVSGVSAKIALYKYSSFRFLSQVSSSYVYSFKSYRVDKQTNKQTNKQSNKQTPLKTSNALRYATTLGKYHTSI